MQRPTLSVVVPGIRSASLDGNEGLADALAALAAAPKQQRLFPIACRVVPTDQWFTSRVDRTWTVLDLKLWLLSKALPANTLTLPPFFRPSSPVTFATAPPQQQPLPLPDGDSSLLDDDDDDTFNDDVAVNHVRPAPQSIPYSFSTGAPAISGLDALRAHAAAARPYGSDPDLLKRADAIASRWRVYSFSTGMQLTDDLPLSQFNILPHELLELHSVAAYVRLPRTVLPQPNPTFDDDDHLSTKPAVARAYHSLHTRKPSLPDASSIHAFEEPPPPPNISLRGGSPYAQPYFDAHVQVLTHDRAKRDRDRDRDKGDDTWSNRWLMIRQGLLTIWKDRKELRAESTHDISACVGLYGPEKLPSSPGPSVSRAHNVVCARFLSSSSLQDPAAWLILKLPDDHTHEHFLRILHRLAYTSTPTPHPPTTSRSLRTAFLPNPIPRPLAVRFGHPGHGESFGFGDNDGDSEDEDDHEKVDLPQFLEEATAGEYGARLWVGMGTRSGVRFPEWREAVLTRAICAGMGVAMDDEIEGQGYDEDDDDRAERERLRNKPVLQSPPPDDADEAFAYSYDSDNASLSSTSSTWSETEWDSWAYDLDRLTVPTPAPRRRRHTRMGPKTPHGSPASASWSEGSGGSLSPSMPVFVQLDEPPARTAGRTRSATLVAAPTPTPTPTPIVSVRPPSLPPPQPQPPSPRPLPQPPRTRDRASTVHTSGQGVRGLMRGLSMRAGRESFRRGLENALDFVDGK